MATAASVRCSTARLAGERIGTDDALVLLRSRDLVGVGRAADELRGRKVDPKRVTFIIDRNVNYTNICHTDCDFCAFYRRPGDRREGYLLPKPVIFKKIEETLALGGTGLLMQGGHHPDLGIDYYEDLFRARSRSATASTCTFSRRPRSSTSPGARSFRSRRRCRVCGMQDSIPSREVVPRSSWTASATSSPEEDEVGRVARGDADAHRLGVSSTATMMYGHVETLEDRVEHLRKIRDLQDETGGFRAFISWTFQADGNRLAAQVAPDSMPTSFDYLLTQAVSRIYLDNVDHIQSSWVTQGMKVGQVALGFGADDMGSVMIEENVVSAAGTTHRATTDDFVRAIRALGKVPVQRDTLYREVKVW